MNQKPTIIVICGPTGIGKTSAGIEAAEAFGGEIISADSMQIYKHMDIGTAKPTSEERARIFHHMIDIIAPDEEFSAAKFALAADNIIDSLKTRGITPFLVGGTGLYIKALVHGLFSPGTSFDETRNRLRKEAETDGTESLYERLLKSDREAADKIHPNDTFRVIRALEVFETTGMTISEHHKKHRFSGNRFNVLKIGLTTEREDLYKRIEKRVDLMIEAGFAQEVKRLLEMNYQPGLKSMQSIGYRHMVEYVTGRIPLDETVKTLKQDTRRFAKRQMTWFNADPEIVWIKPDQVNDIIKLAGSFLKATGMK